MKEYQSLALLAGLQELSVTADKSQLKWENLDKFIDKMYGLSGGRFNQSQINNDALQHFKKNTDDGPVVEDELLEVIEVILSKLL